MIHQPTITAHRRLGRLPSLTAAISLGAVSALGLTAGSALPVFAQGDTQVVMNVVAATGPTVVTIQVTTGGSATSSSDGIALPEMQGSGSGVIVDPSGFILTNRHVAGDATKVVVILADGTEYPGRTVGVDTLTDFAFVKIEATNLPTAQLGDSSALRVGQMAIAMGNPLGDLPGSVTSGIVSGLDRTIAVSDMLGQGGEVLRHLIQTDASINSGNSGGPLLDGDGKVVGINTAKDGSSNGIGFALPIDLAKPIIAQVLAGKPIERPWIGIQFQTIDAQVAEDNDLPVSLGAWVQAATQGDSPAVVGDSPAEKAGVKDGDIITALDGKAIDQQLQLDLLLLQHQPGETVKLSVLRGGETVELEVVLGTRPAAV